MLFRLKALLRDLPTIGALAGLCGALVIHLFEVTQGIGNALEGPHDFRQSQTALSTHYLLRSGFRIDYETPVFGSPASIPFEFPTYQVAVVGVHKVLGCRLDVSGRVTSIFFFYAALPLIALTLRRLRLPWAVICLGIATLLFSPVYIFYTRAFLIESTALFTSWAFLFPLSILLFRDPATDPASGKRRRWILAACTLAAGMLAAVTKITTFAVHAAGILLLWLAYHREHSPPGWADAATRSFVRKSLLLLGTLFAVILVGAVAWTRYTDTVKLQNPSSMAHHITSTGLNNWNFGYDGQLLKISTWRKFYDHFLTSSVGSFFPVGLALICFPLIRGHRRTILALLLAYLTGPILFTNLFFVHDYYWYANTVFLSLACGITIGTFLLEYPAGLQTKQLLIIMVVFITSQAAAYHYSGYHLLQRSPPHETGQIAETVRQNTGADSSIVVFGFDWNPMIPYYADRRAFMVPWDNQLFFERGSQQAIANMIEAGHPIDAVVFGGATALDDALHREVLARLPGHFVQAHHPAGALVLTRKREASTRHTESLAVP